MLKSFSWALSQSESTVSVLIFSKDYGLWKKLKVAELKCVLLFDVSNGYTLVNK